MHRRHSWNIHHTISPFWLRAISPIIFHSRTYILVHRWRWPTTCNDCQLFLCPISLGCWLRNISISVHATKLGVLWTLSRWSGSLLFSNFRKGTSLRAMMCKKWTHSPTTNLLHFHHTIGCNCIWKSQLSSYPHTYHVCPYFFVYSKYIISFVINVFTAKEIQHLWSQ